MHHIKEILEVNPYKIKLRFNTEEELTVDFEERLKLKSKSDQSIYTKLLDPKYFSSVKLNHEMQSIYWDNGVDFCPDVLYMMAKNIEFKFNENKNV